MVALKADQLIRFGKRISVLVIGLAVNKAIDYWYDFVIYPDLIVVYGLLIGWLYAVIGSIVLCLGTLWFYDLTKKDWIGIETIKLVRDGSAEGRIRRFFKNIANRSDALVFIFLCVKYDPFITTVYMRRGSGNNVMTSRDWKIFWASIAVSNVWWGMVVFGAIKVFKWLAPFLPPFVLNWFTSAFGAVEIFNRWIASFVPHFLSWFGLN